MGSPAGGFHAQLGARVRTSEALDVASSLFFDGLEHFSAGAHTEALARFEQALAINQKYLMPSSREMVLCYNNIGAVHDKLGNLDAALSYYERARRMLHSRQTPRDERSVIGRRRRSDLLRHVERKLEEIPRTGSPKVGAGVNLDEVRSLKASVWAEAEAQCERREFRAALASYEMVYTLDRKVADSSSRALRSSAELLARIGFVLIELGEPAQACCCGGVALLLWPVVVVRVARSRARPRRRASTSARRRACYLNSPRSSREIRLMMRRGMAPPLRGGARGSSRRCRSGYGRTWRLEDRDQLRRCATSRRIPHCIPRTGLLAITRGILRAVGVG